MTWLAGRRWGSAETGQRPFRQRDQLDGREPREAGPFTYLRHLLTVISFS
jgi:hypothetical protein